MASPHNRRPFSEQNDRQFWTSFDRMVGGITPPKRDPFLVIYPPSALKLELPSLPASLEQYSFSQDTNSSSSPIPSLKADYSPILDVTVGDILGPTNCQTQDDII